MLLVNPIMKKFYLLHLLHHLFVLRLELQHFLLHILRLRLHQHVHYLQYLLNLNHHHFLGEDLLMVCFLYLQVYL
jgi:hypothetical protein